MLLDEVYNLRGVTPFPLSSILVTKLDEVYNLRGVTPMNTKMISPREGWMRSTI
jgi:hypothetical protein